MPVKAILIAALLMGPTPLGQPGIGPGIHMRQATTSAGAGVVSGSACATAGYTLASCGADCGFGLDTSSTVPSLCNLEREITINSTTETLDGACYATDLSGGSWACYGGGSLSEAGTGTSPSAPTSVQYYDQDAGATGKAVEFTGGGKYFVDSGTTFGDVGAEDLYIEMLIRTPAAGTAFNRGILGKRLDSTGDGWQIITLTNSNAQLRFSAKSDLSTNLSSSILTTVPGALMWVQFAFSQTEASGARLQAWVNGIEEIDVTHGSWVDGTLTNSQAFSLGSATDSGSFDAWGGDILYVGFASASGWFSQVTDTEAYDRFAILNGTRPQHPTSITWSYSGSPDATRDLTYFYADGTSDLFAWPYIPFHNIARPEAEGSWRVTQEAVNRLVQSEDFATSWTTTGGVTVSDNVADGPCGSGCVDEIVADTSTGTHCITQAHTADEVFSVFAQNTGTGTTFEVTWLRLTTNRANLNAYFDIANCQVGTRGSEVSHGAVVDYSSGYCRISMVANAIAGNTLNICLAEADGDDSFTGDSDGSQKIRLWGAQVADWQTGGGVVGYQKTTTTADSSAISGFVRAQFSPGFSNPASATQRIKFNMHWYDGSHIGNAPTTDTAFQELASPGKVWEMWQRNISPGVIQWSFDDSSSAVRCSGLSTSSVCCSSPNPSYDTYVAWNGNTDCQIYVNGVSEATDSSVGTNGPPDLDTLYMPGVLGTQNVGVNIEIVELHDAVVTP